MPSITRVSADYDDGHITVDVKGYTGGVQVIVCDSQGNVVSSTMSSITNSGVVSFDLGALAEGGYSLNIILDTCKANLNDCFPNIMQVYGKEHWDYPDPRCDKAPRNISDKIYV